MVAAVMRRLLCLLCWSLMALCARAPAAEPAPAARPLRARDLGVPFEGQPGPHNAITDVPRVEVGHTTLIRGADVRTGVTAILPCWPPGRARPARCVAGVVSLNGNGEMTGAHWIRESGLLESPILLTNTHSVGAVHAATIAWGNRRFPPADVGQEAFSLPVVAETYDGLLSDINGFHVKARDVEAALDGARGGPVAEGNVGGGTGMMCAEWKGGIGTSSRVVVLPAGRFTLGALVQANYGRRADLRIAGVPVGQLITDLMPDLRASRPAQRLPEDRKDGSIIVVLGTDAPLLPHQMERLARRAALGLGRMGSPAYNSSGDLFIAFGPEAPAPDARGLSHYRALANEGIDPLLRAAAQATEEAIVNALVAARTMTGRGGSTVHALPPERLQQVLRQHGRLRSPAAR